MTIAVIVLSLMLAFSLIAIFALIARQGPSLLKKTVVIQTKDGKTIRGILHGKYADRWTLREAQIVGAGIQDQPLGGVQHVPVENVSFVQEIEPPAGDSE